MTYQTVKELAIKHAAEKNIDVYLIKRGCGWNLMLKPDVKIHYNEKITPEKAKMLQKH